MFINWEIEKLKLDPNNIQVFKKKRGLSKKNFEFKSIYTCDPCVGFSPGFEFIVK
jgi:hypothetical protein